MWDSVIDRLPQFQCIAPDMPGHGESSALEWTSPREVANDIAYYLSERTLPKAYKKVSLVGLSLGGLVALDLLDQHPQLIDRVLITGVPIVKMPRQWLVRLGGILISPFIHNRALLTATARASRIPQTEIPKYVSKARQNSTRAFRRINNQAVNFAPPISALRSPIPKLFIAGEHDHPKILASLSEFAYQAQNAECYQVPKRGHAWSSQDPSLFAQVVQAWIDETRLPEFLSRVRSS